MHKTSPEVGGMGHSIKRKEDGRFIQGKGNYVDDVNLPGMVFGHMVRETAEVAIGRLVGFRRLVGVSERVRAGVPNG